MVNFYLSEEISRVMPGQKDVVSVHQKDGKKAKLQKHLILCNVKEAYVEFKKENPEIKVGFSKFASLRPKQCILADSHGTHIVCVCKIHQNFKLLLNGLKCIFHEILVTNYIDILNSVICVEPTRDCYFKKCNFCPGIENIVSQIEETLLENNIKSLTYQQWLNTDRSSLETVTQEANDFLNNFKQQLNVLQTHNFIAKNQNKFLKDLKFNLKIGEFIVIGDFSENYTFIIQNAIQSHHWNNSKTTIHPFVIYRSDRDENSIAKFENFVIIS